MKQSAGRLIVFEGVDASGKTTLCDELCESLAHEAPAVKRFSFPGKHPGTLGELVYRFHHSHDTEFSVPYVDPCALQLLHIAAHIDTIELIIKKAVAGGYWVVLDRFWWSTYVYGIDYGVSKQSLQLMIEVEKLAWGSVQPDIVFLIDSPAPIRDDEANSAAWQRKRNLYKELAETEASSYRCVQVQTKFGDAGKKHALAVILSEINAQS